MFKKVGKSLRQVQKNPGCCEDGESQLGTDSQSQWEKLLPSMTPHNFLFDPFTSCGKVAIYP